MIYLFMEEIFNCLESYFLSCLLSVKCSINFLKNKNNQSFVKLPQVGKLPFVAYQYL